MRAFAPLGCTLRSVRLGDAGVPHAITRPHDVFCIHEARPVCWCLAWTCSGADSSSRRGRGNEREARPNRDRGNREDIHGGCASDTAAPGFRRDVAPGSGQPTAADFGRSHRSRADQQPDVLEPTKRSGSSGLGGTRGVCGLLAGSQRLGGVRPHRRRCAASRHGCGLHPEHGLVLFELLAERRLELERLDAVRDPQRPRASPRPRSLWIRR